MLKPALPDSEVERLATLESLNILDTAAEERFDRITRVASKMFQVPTVLVSLIDSHRQWFKSRVGCDVTETPREISLCGHAILSDDTYIIPDASKDPRFADNPLVTGPFQLRFYAGQPLKANNGEKMGTLCLLDTQPRQLQDSDIMALQSLAQMVEAEINAIQIATMDELTGISNRRGFELLAEQCLQLCRRKKFTVSFAYIDLDEFKPINDRHGHKEGDRALTLFAQNLQQALRQSDLIARVGGDEFVALMPDCELTQAKETIARLRAAIDEHCRADSLPYHILFSAGIIQYDPVLHPTIPALIDAADKAMYQVKEPR
ncbi:MAG: sensor domain-containing diguanylate cyclase [Candidatus Pelagadaptatus aseana]|uniref:sensor domain-containing diguanylate cyclase n=1 Tax=Candidatus Pelagadaptatus aseana TaxID=3120508 RepID=UPI0039B1879F